MSATHVLTCATKGCGRCIEVDALLLNALCFKCSPFKHGDRTECRVPLHDVRCIQEWEDDGCKHQCNKVGMHMVHRCCCGSTCAPHAAKHTDAPFTKADAGKPLMGCLPPNALLATARVLTHGAAKYGRENWHKVEAWSRYYDAMQRHLTMWWAGEDKDPDTGESHLAHAAACVMFLQELEALGKSNDDRPALGRVVPEVPDRVTGPMHRGSLEALGVAVCGVPGGFIAQGVGWVRVPEKDRCPMCHAWSP